ncbi:MAG TPA: 3'-5' exonuclease, partial [Burkholderiaceae bacterium]|nr:3'-5' exonuclease [Burkholderiaceae bacterium]
LEMPAEQRDTSRDFSVRLLNGVAGSGKTLIAIHRALLLAELFPRQRILVLIHNTPIVADLKDRLHRARGGLPRNVEMQTFFAWIRRQWRRLFGVFPAIAEHEDVLELVHHHRLRLPGLSASDARLVAELDFIDDSLISDEAGYLAARRAGRGFALRAAERRQVWALYEAVTESLRRRHLHTWSALPRAICLACNRHAALERFHHILADEAQFFAPAWFQVVKLSLAPQGQLFLCADPQQGFLKNRLSWKSAGLDVSGRTKKLRRSYRSTQAILYAAATLLRGAVQPRAGDDFLDPDYADMDAGKAPALVYAASPQDALDRLVNEIASLHAERGIPLGAFLVIYGRNVDRRALYVRLGRRFGAGRVWWFNEHSQKKEPPQGHGQDYLRMAYVDSATGLEGAIVFLIGTEPLFFSGEMGAVGDEERREEEARKLYMAMTRAGRRLVVVASQRLPERAEEVFDLVPEAPSDVH